MTDLSERETASMGTSSSILEHVMLVGLLSSAATMGQFLASTLSLGISDIYNQHGMNTQITQQPAANSSNPFAVAPPPTQGTKAASSDLSKYHQRWGR